MVELQDRAVMGNEGKGQDTVQYKGVTVHATGGDNRVGFNSEDVNRIHQIIDIAIGGNLGTTETAFLNNAAPIAEQISGKQAGKTHGFLTNIWLQVELNRTRKV